MEKIEQLVIYLYLIFVNRENIIINKLAIITKQKIHNDE